MVALGISLIGTSIGGALISGIASLLAGSGLAAFVQMFLLSVLGGTAINMVGVALPLYFLMLKGSTSKD